MTETP